MPKHILFIFTDQQRRDTIHALGNEFIQTPAFDELANTSTVFDTAITPAPVCVPARLSMLAGQYPARTGCNNNNKGMVYDGEGFYDTVTKSGFRSCCVGKMHNSRDPYGSMGFEKRYTQEELSNPEDDYTKFIVENFPWVFDYNGMRSEMYYVPQVSQLPPAAHPTQWVGDKSLEFLDSIDTSKGENVFLMSSFIHPHPPFCPPAPWNKLYRDDVYPPHIPENAEEFKPLVHWKFSLENMDTSARDVQRLRDFYYACISFVDYQIGRIIAKLKEKGMYDDTMIIFSSDHGELLGDFACMGKRSMVDPSCHIPLMIHMPGQTEQKRRTDPVSLVDIAPTVLDFIGADYDKSEFDGVGLFSGEHHEYVYSQYDHNGKGAYMVTDGKNKLVYNCPDDRYYFFDTAPEDRNKYDGMKDTETVRTLKGLLDAYRESDEGNRIAPAESIEKSTAKKRKLNPHYPTRMDHVKRRVEEAACIPEGYKIDF